MFVAHERAFETAATATAMLQGARCSGRAIGPPKKLHGLSHREFGDHAHLEAMLLKEAHSAASDPGGMRE